MRSSLRLPLLASLLIALGGLALVAGCPVRVNDDTAVAPASSASPDVVLRAYDVPEAYASEVLSLSRSLLHRGKDVAPAGTAALGPGGQLLVAAPASFHSGMRDVVERLAKSPPPAPKALTFDYWVVAGAPGEPSSTIASPEIEDAVGAIQKTQGPMRLRLLERLRAKSVSGERARVQGASVEVSQEATVQGDHIIADLDLLRTRGGGRFQGRVNIAPGKTLVLGQAGAEMFEGEPFADERQQGQPRPTATLFYIVRATAE